MDQFAIISCPCRRHLDIVGNECPSPSSDGLILVAFAVFVPKQTLEARGLLSGGGWICYWSRVWSCIGLDSVERICHG